MNACPLRRMTARTSSRAGYSLVEVLVAMVIMMIVLAGIYTIWFGLQRTYAFTEEDIDAQEQARNAMAEMVDLIRTSRQPDAPPNDSLRYVIVSADANSLVSWTDVDRDVNHDLELVRFRVDTTARTLFRDTSQSGDATFSTGSSVRLVGNWISNNASNPLFVYRDSNGSVLSTPVSDPLEIRTVVIDLRIDIETDKAPIAHRLTSVVQPRNLRTY